jgi:prepilin peptidase CpaA
MQYRPEPPALLRHFFIRHFGVAMPATLSTIFPAGLLVALLLAAVWHDVRGRRIPNSIVFPGACAGLLLHTVLATGDGFFSASTGALGPLASIEGLVLGLAILLPMYMLRAMGAGDVKLLAMVGAFTGPVAIIGIAIATMLAGGVLAIAVSVYNGNLSKMLNNSYHMVLHSVLGSIAGDVTAVPAPAAPSGKLPYAIAIAAGTGAYLALTVALAGSRHALSF